jgi:arabinofuranosyltransferase
LLFLPPLGWALLESRSLRHAAGAVLGLAPLLAWELFSLLYYGFLLPNTYYAKLNTGLIARADLVQHGGYYLLQSLSVDPLTLTVIAVAVGLTLASRAWRRLPIVAGILAYLAYLVWIGGDFMSGRFLAAPLVAAVALLVGGPWLRARRWLPTSVLVVVIAFGVLAPGSPLVRGGLLSAAVDPGSWLASRGIADEAANYYPNAGLLMALQRPDLPDHDWALAGRAARENGPGVIALGSVGFYGYFAGPDVTIIDVLGLCDPLIARLPPNDPGLRIGHLGRTVPAGYAETLESGETRIDDPDLAEYYARLDALIRGPLWEPLRLVEIWRFNTGAYDAHLEAYAWSRGGPLEQDLTITNPGDRPYVYAYVWNNDSAEAFVVDADSERAATYRIRWSISPGAIRFEGPREQQISSLQELWDGQTLNVGVFFSDSATLDHYEAYERRFWFRQDGAGGLTVVLPGTEWHNSDAPGGLWRQESIEAVLQQE